MLPNSHAARRFASSRAPRRHIAALLSAAAWALSAVALGCGGVREPLSKQGSEIVYGEDDRLEYFELTNADWRTLLDTSIVALVPRDDVREARGEVHIDAPSWGDLASLCPGERFAEQPAAAFCSGVLVDWDLVLTAGHCARVYAPEDIAFVFDYHYAAPGTLALHSTAEIARATQVIAERLDGAAAVPRLDYAWFRLDRPVSLPRMPAAVRRTAVPGAPVLASGDRVTVVAASSGLPNKLDPNGRVTDPRSATADYFIAETDTFEGASGGGAFDPTLALVGVLARGQSDLAITEAGCNVTVRDPESSAPNDSSGAPDANDDKKFIDTRGEDFTYADRAIADLCAQDPSASSLCRADCGDPCRALPPAARRADSGCALRAPGSASASAALTIALASALVLLSLRAQGRRLRNCPP